MKVVKTLATLAVVTASLAPLAAPAVATAAADLPLRQAVEDQGGQVFWNVGDATVTVQLPGGDATLKPGSLQAAIQGKKVTLTTAPYIQNNRTYVQPYVLQQIQDAIKVNPVVLAFSSVGDSRIEEGVPAASKQDLIWLNNSKVFNRMEREIVAQQSKMMFFNGDMIMGYTPNSNTNELNRQYAFWRGMGTGFFENGVYLFPVPGNHEVQDKYKDANGKTVKIATKANEDTWRANMGDIIVDQDRAKQLLGEPLKYDAANHPQVGQDHVTTDQSQLDYSFDYKDTHFTVINTDPVGYDSHAPIEWLKKDLADARARGAKHLFVFGHKLAYTYLYDQTAKTGGGLDADLPSADAFWQVIQDAKATYFCGHEHIFNITQPKGGQAYQVVVGSGGSPFEAQAPTGNPTDRMYAWATTRVYADGSVHVDAYGFDENYGPTQHITGLDLAPGF